MSLPPFRRFPELALVGVGIALRVAMPFTYAQSFGYDANDHWNHIRWFATNWSLPPLMLSRETYQPPLYYAMAGALFRAFGSIRGVALLSGVCSCLTLLLLWWGLERHLKGYRLARLVALALAAVLHAAVHMNGMLNAEGLNGLLAVCALLMGAELASTAPRRPFLLATLLGMTLGLEMLTKISAAVTIAAVFAAGGLQVLWTRGSPALRLRVAAFWVLAGVAMLGTCTWYFARNQRLYGKAVLTGFDGVDSKTTANLDTVYLDRRPLGFFVGWSNDVFVFPYYPTAIQPISRFWPVLVSDTFSDFYSYAYVKPPLQSTVYANTQLLPPRSIKFARASVAGGAMIALTTAIAWLCVVRGLWRRRDLPRLLLLTAPLLALLGQIHGVVVYPFDYQGPIKGMYMQFASAPLFALFGLSVSWLTSRRATLPLAVVEGLALAAVAAYTIYARMSWLWPASFA